RLAWRRARQGRSFGGVATRRMPAGEHRDELCGQPRVHGVIPAPRAVGRPEACDAGRTRAIPLPLNPSGLLCVLVVESDATPVAAPRPAGTVPATGGIRCLLVSASRARLRVRRRRARIWSHARWARWRWPRWR